MVSMQTLGTG